VILTGGIDLSSVRSSQLTTIISAALVERTTESSRRHSAGPRHRCLVRRLDGSVDPALSPAAFHVTLAGMFLARGLCYLISIDFDQYR